MGDNGKSFSKKKNKVLDQVWKYRPIPVLGRLRQESLEFKVSWAT
jgi:hypothetical protein